jgi:hypothetical protein
MKLKNISNFSCTSDYLPILNGAIIVDLVVVLRVIFKQIKSKSLTEWYKKYGICSILADVLSLVIGVVITRFIYPFIFNSYSLVLFICLAVAVQLTHDLLFAFFFNSIPRGASQIMDTFKDYGKEFGSIILLADALMIIFTILIGSLLASQSLNTNIIILIFLSYIVPYFLYSV